MAAGTERVVRVDGKINAAVHKDILVDDLLQPLLPVLDLCNRNEASNAASISILLLLDNTFKENANLASSTDRPKVSPCNQAGSLMAKTKNTYSCSNSLVRSSWYKNTLVSVLVSNVSVDKQIEDYI